MCERYYKIKVLNQNMPITKLPFTEIDKKVLKTAFRNRIIIGVLFLIPLLAGLGLLSYNSILDFKENNYDFMTFAGIFISLVSGYLFFKFVIPFYKNSFKNVQASNKLVIETYISAIKEEHTNKGMRYVVETDDITIYSWQVAILSSSLPFNEMKVNMKIKIHQLENNNTDILYIEIA